MVNAKFEVPLVGCLSLELGAGLGIVYTHADASASFRGFSASASDSDWNFGFQALGGLNFKLCEAASLRAGYRFFYVDEDDIQGHFLGGGLTVRF